MDRRTFLAGLGSGIVAIAPVLAQAQARTARQLAEQFAATLSAHDIDAFAALFDDGYVNHQRSAAVAPPPAGLSPKQASVGIFVYTGTHQGILLGVPATGKPLRFTSCDILRVAGGKLVEHWGMGDIAGVLAQIKG